MAKEFFDLREALGHLKEAAPKISQGKAKGAITATGMRGKGMKKYDVSIKVVNGKLEFRIMDDTGKFQTVGIKQAAKMLGEEVQLEEAMDQKKFTAGAKAMKTYAQKSGGVDKKDFMEVSKLLDQIGRVNILQAGQLLSRLNRIVDGMDTDVRERVFIELKKVGLVESVESINEEQMRITIIPKKGDKESKAAIEYMLKKTGQEVASYGIKGKGKDAYIEIQVPTTKVLQADKAMHGKKFGKYEVRVTGNRALNKYLNESVVYSDAKSVELDEQLDENNSDKYMWKDINAALMKAGVNTSTIMKVVSALKNKAIKEAEEPASPDEASMAMDQAKFIGYVSKEIMEYIQGNKEFPEWMQNKLSALHQKSKDMHAVMAGKYNESVEIDESRYGTQAQRLMSPLQKARQDKEKRDRDRDGKLKSTSLPMRRKKEEVEEAVKFTDKQIKMAYGVANDKRYKGGNYSGAVRAIEKIAKGLSDHPDVKKVLQRTNESTAAYRKSQEKIANDKKKANIKPSELNKLAKIRAMLDREKKK